MMLPADSVARFRRIADRAAEALGEDGVWLERGLRAWLRLSVDISLDDAFGVAALPGQASWRAAERRRLRNRALARFARESFPLLSDRALVNATLMEVRSYATRRWSQDRKAGTLPTVYRDSPRRHLFEAFRLSEAGSCAIPVSPNGLAKAIAEGLAAPVERALSSPISVTGTGSTLDREPQTETP